MRSPGRVRSLLATTAGQIGEGALAFLFVPVFLALLGDEGWGLAALVPLVNAIIGIAGFPLATTINRELSRLARLADRQSAAAESDGNTPVDTVPAGAIALSTEPSAEATSLRGPSRADAGHFDPAETHRVVRTVGVLFGAIAALTAVAVWLAAPWIAAHWLRPGEIDHESCVAAIRWVGVTAALLVPRQAALGALFGLGRPLAANGLSLATACLATLVGLVVAGPLAGGPVAFIASQALCQGAGTLATSLWVRASLPRLERGVRHGPDLATWWRLWPFVRGMLAIAATGVIFGQLDRIVVSRALPLGEYGLYAAAATLASGLSLLLRAVNLASFPDLSRVFAHPGDHDEAERRSALHRWCQASMTIVVPAAVTLCVFSNASLTAWLGPDTVREPMPGVLTALAAGWLLNALATVPFSAALAAGWTRFQITQNILALGVAMLALLLLVPWLGAVGAALIWTSINAVAVLVGIPFAFFPKLLPRARRAWIVGDVLAPLLTMLAAAIGLRLALPAPSTRGEAIAVVLAVGAILSALALVTSPVARQAVGLRLRNRVRAMG